MSRILNLIYSPVGDRTLSNRNGECDKELHGKIWPRGYKTFYMLNPAEREIFSANKCENVNKYLLFSYLLAEKFSCSVMFS